MKSAPSGERVQGRQEPVQDRDRARQVADGLRRALPAHDVRGQADAGHGLIQAIARVNRFFRDKPGGLVVDYLSLADQLKHALRDYTESGGKGNLTFDNAQAFAVMLEKHSIACDLMRGFNVRVRRFHPGEARASATPGASVHLRAGACAQGVS